MFWKHHLRFAAFCIGLGITMAAQAQGPIKVQVGIGGPITGYPDDEPILVNVGTVAGELEMRVYDENTLDVMAGTPIRSIPPITINGAVGVGTDLRLSVVIGDGDNEFPTNTIEQVDTGAIDFAGLTVANAGLREITRVAVAVSGDITGTIDVGHVYRIQALGRIDGGTFTGGRILGDIIARVENGDPILDSSGGHHGGTYSPIEFVQAGDLISGDILAGWDPALGTAVTASDIGSIRVGNINNIDPATLEPAAAGITGDIRAEMGHIGTIYTEGPIGTSAVARSTILAGNGIEEVRAIHVDESGEALTATFYADIQANRLIETNPTGFAYAGPLEDGVLGLIETNGDYHGTIKAGNLNVGPFFRTGIWVGGVVDASINIDFNLQFANIVAHSFLKPIYIGRCAKGAIIATGDGATPGLIHSIEIGYAELTETLEVIHYGDYTPGLSGIVHDGLDSCTPIENLSPAIWFAAEPPLDACIDSSAWDGAIRARDQIGSVKIRMMTRRWHTSDVKTLVPRIEAPQIDELVIDDMREGVVWSGLLERDQSGIVNPENDYAVIGASNIGCMGPAADIWSTGSIDVTGEVLGEIHVDALDPGEVVRIGGRLADWPATLAGSTGPWDTFVCGDDRYSLSDFNELSPRDSTWSDEESRRRGAVRILEPDGLAGQVVINASGDPLLPTGEGWDGWVIVGDGSPYSTPIVLDPGPEVPALRRAPFYSATPTTLGGGAVGLVPFNMHGLASSPPYDGTPVARLVSDFNGMTADPSGHFDILIEHYGPIKGGPDPIAVDMFDETINDWMTGIDLDIYQFQTAVGDPTLNNRTVRIHSLGGKVKGLFRFRPGSTLVCADLLSATDVPVFPWEYQIDLRPDCDFDGIEDPPTGSDPDTSTCGSGLLCCDIDGATGVDVFDLLEYLDRWFASSPSAEWDGVAGINVFDLLAYLDCWFSTNPCH